MSYKLVTIGDKIEIIISEENLNAKIEKYHIIYQSRMYEGFGSFRCITKGQEDKSLYSHIKGEFFDMKDDLHVQFVNMTKNIGQDFGGELQKLMLEVLAKQSSDKVINEMKPMLDEYIKETYGDLPKKFEVQTPTIKYEGKGVVHEEFDNVLQMVNLNIPVYLSGPAGTGKNVICKQVAESLGLEFYFTNAVTQEYKLTGFIDANGHYQETQFYKAFKDGGLFFLDEMDASIPEVLIILNAALANKYFDFPNGKIIAHPDFRVIAAGNTNGQGANIEYSGRYQLDAASLDRFALINIYYSEEIEKSLAENDEELLQFIRDFRRVTDNNGIKCVCSYRTIERIKKLETVFDNTSQILKMALLKNINEDDLNIIKSKMANENKYTLAL